MAADPSDGWRTGRDPVQRILRVATVVVCLITFTALALDGSRHLDVVPLAGLAIGAVMLLLGYERSIMLPGIGRKDDDK